MALKSPAATPTVKTIPIHAHILSVCFELLSLRGRWIFEPFYAEHAHVGMAHGKMTDDIDAMSFGYMHELVDLPKRTLWEIKNLRLTQMPSISDLILFSSVRIEPFGVCVATYHVLNDCSVFHDS